MRLLLLAALAVALSACVFLPGLRSGNGLIAHKGGACPAVQERHGNLIIFRDVEGDGCP